MKGVILQQALCHISSPGPFPYLPPHSTDWSEFGLFFPVEELANDERGGQRAAVGEKAKGYNSPRIRESSLTNEEPTERLPVAEPTLQLSYSAPGAHISHNFLQLHCYTTRHAPQNLNSLDKLLYY